MFYHHPIFFAVYLGKAMEHTTLGGAYVDVYARGTFQVKIAPEAKGWLMRFHNGLRDEMEYHYYLPASIYISISIQSV